MAVSAAGVRSVLRLDHVPDEVRAAVLVLHGGRVSGRTRPPSRWAPPALRMVPFGRAVRRATAGHGVALGSVGYRYLGWNGDHADPARDATAALDHLRDRLGLVPVVLIGHSMGGRAALHAAGHPLVRAVIGLAPWCPPDDPVTQLTGRRTVLLHCPADRITSFDESRQLVARARTAGAPACLVTMPHGGHTMLRSAPAWHTLTADLTTALLDLAPMPSHIEDALT